MPRSTSNPRHDGRVAYALRPVEITPHFMKHAEGSALIKCGDTHVICAASVEDRVPHFLRGQEQGWVTAEYGMLPRSTSTRMIRESSRGKPSGRTQEIQRLIGRALRSVVDLKRLGERTMWVDCDVIQADGGTRTASITGAFVAVALALEALHKREVIADPALIDSVAAVSVGIVGEDALLDLNYVEDFAAEVDMNVVMTGGGDYVEVQGTAEGVAFSREQLDQLLALATTGVEELTRCQLETLGEAVGSTDHLFRSPEVAVASGDHK